MKIVDKFHTALNQGIAADIFNNLRNLVTCTLIFAAAMTAPKHHESLNVFGSFQFYMGSFIALIAIALALLNLYDGAYRIFRQGGARLTGSRVRGRVRHAFGQDWPATLGTEIFRNLIGMPALPAWQKCLGMLPYSPG